MEAKKTLVAAQKIREDTTESNQEVNMKERTEVGFVTLEKIASLYAQAQKEQKGELMNSLQDAARAMAQSYAEAAYATTLAAFADEASGGGIG